MAEHDGDVKEEVRKLSGKADTRGKARELAYRGIQRSPGDAELRLLLAKLYYLDGFFEFAARELIEVQYIQPTPSVEKLLEQFAEYSAPLLARHASFPTASGRKAPAKPAAEKKPEKGDVAEHEVLADLDVDLDLFDE